MKHPHQGDAVHTGGSGHSSQGQAQGLILVRVMLSACAGFLAVQAPWPFILQARSREGRARSLRGQACAQVDVLTAYGYMPTVHHNRPATLGLHSIQPVRCSCGALHQPLKWAHDYCCDRPSSTQYAQCMPSHMHRVWYAALLWQALWRMGRRAEAEEEHRPPMQHGTTLPDVVVTPDETPCHLQACTYLCSVTRAYPPCDMM